MELPNPKIKEVTGVVLSNTCDIDQSNRRLYPSRLIHAPIINLTKYQDMLIDKFVHTKIKTDVEIRQHIASIKKQYISHIFYLPRGSNLTADSFIFFDRISSLPSSFIPISNIIEKRIFSLSDFGFYLFLFKLSVHFTRVRENVSRNPPSTFC
jgi:hypothetical protein